MPPAVHIVVPVRDAQFVVHGAIVPVRRLQCMGSWMVQRRLRATSKRLVALRNELRVIDEQRIQLSDDAADLELRAMMSDAPLDRSEAHDAAGHAEAMSRHRAHVVAEIAELEARQDSLLDQLTSG